MPNNAVYENIATLAATVAVVLGALALDAGGWSFLGLALLGNLNYVKRENPTP